MEKKTIKIEDQNVINLLESLSVEVNARKDLLAFMVGNGTAESAAESFAAYHKEYESFYVQYEAAKTEFQARFVDTIPGAVDWKLDFKSRSLTVTVR